MKKSAYIPLLLLLSLCSLNSCKEKKYTSHSPAGERTEEKNKPEEAQKRKLEDLKNKREAAADVLRRAIKITQEEIFTLEDAKNKGVTIVCSPEDADLLLHIILNHDEKDDNGRLCWGPDTIGTALQGCVLLGIASEQDPAICEKVFTTLAEHATKMEPRLLDELLDRLTKANIKNINSKLNALGDKLTLQDNADVLAVIRRYKERKLEDLKKKREAAADVLRRAIKITQEEIFTLEDAKNKGVTIVCSPEDADLLLHIILNHDEKDDNGRLCWGPDTIGTALQGCVLLGIASEQDPAICEKVFTTLAEHATKIEPVLLDELLDRLTKTEIKNLNRKLNALADNLGIKEHADLLAIIWGYKARRASMKDKQRVIHLIKTKDLDGNLLNAVSAYTFALIKNTDSAEEKAAFGKLIWEAIKGDEDRLGNQSIMRMLAYTCQPDALEYYKGKMENKDNWKQYSHFFGAWHGDEIASYLNELRSTCGPDDEKKANIIDTTIMRVLTQDRERSVEEAIQLLTMAYEDFFADTTALQDLYEKDTDRTPEEEAEFHRLSKVVEQQTRVVQNLACYCKEYYDWVEVLLDKIAEDCDKANSQQHRKLKVTIRKARGVIKEAETRKLSQRVKMQKRKKLEE